jgi:hypothetical protein
MTTLIAPPEAGDLGELGAEVEGDAGLLDVLRGIVDLPDTHRKGAEEIVAAQMKAADGAPA